MRRGQRMGRLEQVSVDALDPARLELLIGPDRAGDHVRRILVGVDGSACSRNALQFAVLLAKPWDAQIIATTVWEPRAQPSASVLAEERNSLRRLMEDEWCAPARSARVDIECHVVDGETPDALLDIADAKGVDLIALGRRGSGGFAGLHFGSVVDAVAHRTERPLLVVAASVSTPRG